MSNAISSSKSRATHAVQLANRYLAPWNESDADRRRRMIDELWTESGSQILQPPMEMREIAASPGLGLAATLEARGHNEHWVTSEGSSSAGAKTPSDSATSSSSAGSRRQGRRRDGGRAHFLVLAADGRIERNYIRRELGG